MFNYAFYRKGDPNKERINLTSAESVEEAIKIFAKVKNLPEKIFLTLYGVEIYEKSA